MFVPAILIRLNLIQPPELQPFLLVIKRLAMPAANSESQGVVCDKNCQLDDLRKDDRYVSVSFPGSPAVVGNTRRPEALRPCLSAGLPFSVQCDLNQLTVLRQGIAAQKKHLKLSPDGKLTSLCQAKTWYWVWQDLPTPSWLRDEPGKNSNSECECNSIGVQNRSLKSPKQNDLKINVLGIQRAQSNSGCI